MPAFFLQVWHCNGLWREFPREVFHKCTRRFSSTLKDLSRSTQLKPARFSKFYAGNKFCSNIRCWFFRRWQWSFVQYIILHGWSRLNVVERELDAKFVQELTKFGQIHENDTLLNCMWLQNTKTSDNHRHSPFVRLGCRGARKCYLQKMNTLLPMGVFTQHCMQATIKDLRPNLLTRPGFPDNLNHTRTTWSAHLDSSQQLTGDTRELVP